MAARSYNHQQEIENSMENNSDSPRSTWSNDSKSKRRRGTEKRVISVPIKDIEGFRVRGDHMSAPPPDSWAWRKYGQKPIKGSPYPRSYYRCSSSKGCPARKQVERSKLDPNFLVVTYSCEHNHSSPALSSSRNHRRRHRNVITSSSTASLSEEDEEDEEYEEEEDNKEEVDEEEKKPFVNNQLPQSQERVQASEIEWFDFEPTSCCTLLLDQCPILIEEKGNDTTDDDEMAVLIATREEEDESLFADLGELPECSAVFRR